MEPIRLRQEGDANRRNLGAGGDRGNRTRMDGHNTHRVLWHERRRFEHGWVFQRARLNLWDLFAHNDRSDLSTCAFARSLHGSHACFTPTILSDGGSILDSIKNIIPVVRLEVEEHNAQVGLV